MQDIRAKIALEEVLKLWPTRPDEAEDQIRARLEGRVSDSLHTASLRLLPGGAWYISCPLLFRPGRAKCLIVDTKHNQLPVLAELHLQNDAWMLVAFDEQCPACFGLGVNNECVCDLCYGKGWGCYAD